MKNVITRVYDLCLNIRHVQNPCNLNNKVNVTRGSKINIGPELRIFDIISWQNILPHASIVNFKYVEWKRLKIVQQLINKLHAFQIVGSQHCLGSN